MDAAEQFMMDGAMEKTRILEEELELAYQREAKIKKEKFEAESQAYQYKTAYVILIKTLTSLNT